MPIGVMLRLVCGRFAAVETWYSRSASAVTDGIPIGLNLAKARSECLSANAYIEGYRVFNTDTLYDVRNISLVGVSVGGTLGIVGQLPKTGPGFADVQTSSLLVKAYGVQGGRARTSNREMFGVPDSINVTSELGNRMYLPTAYFEAGFADFRAEIVANWDFRVLAIAPRHTITSLVIDQAPPGYLGIRADLAGDATIAPGKRIRIRGAVRQTTLYKLNGLWTVSHIDTPVAPSVLSTVYLIGSQGSDTLGYDPLGTIEGISYAYCHAADYKIQRPMGRKRGGSCGLPRGRSPARTH